MGGGGEEDEEEGLQAAAAVNAEKEVVCKAFIKMKEFNKN